MHTLDGYRVGYVVVAVLFAATAFAGCGGSSSLPPTRSATEATASAPIDSPAGVKSRSTPIDDPPSGLLPTRCADPSAALCIPPEDFVERLCDKPRQDVALALFAQKGPFSRVYARGRIDELVADEELLVLRFHAPQKGGIVVGANAGSYDVLRWDGTCSKAIEAEVVARARPAHASWAHVQWHRISAGIQDALVAGSDAVKRAHAKRGKECRGAMSGDVSVGCERADGALVAAIVDYIRSGPSLPPLANNAL